MVFKKDLTPLTGKGQVLKHKGKGSRPLPPRPMMDQLAKRYPKPAPEPAPSATPGLTPPFGIGAPPEEE